jgi:hypothetical protein
MPLAAAIDWPTTGHVVLLRWRSGECPIREVAAASSTEHQRRHRPPIRSARKISTSPSPAASSPQHSENIPIGGDNPKDSLPSRGSVRWAKTCVWVCNRVAAYIRPKSRSASGARHGRVLHLPVLGPDLLDLAVSIASVALRPTAPEWSTRGRPSGSRSTAHKSGRSETPWPSAPRRTGKHSPGLVLMSEESRGSFEQIALLPDPFDLTSQTLVAPRASQPFSRSRRCSYVCLTQLAPGRKIGEFQPAVPTSHTKTCRA